LFGLSALSLPQHGLCRGPFGLIKGGTTMAAMDMGGGMMRMAGMG
jgi:hypothetical protein